MDLGSFCVSLEPLSLPATPGGRLFYGGHLPRQEFSPQARGLRPEPLGSVQLFPQVPIEIPTGGLQGVTGAWRQLNRPTPFGLAAGSVPPSGPSTSLTRAAVPAQSTVEWLALVPAPRVTLGLGCVLVEEGLCR